jgi:hypothetical protein
MDYYYAAGINISARLGRGRPGPDKAQKLMIPLLALAGRQALPGLHPLQRRCFAVTNGTAKPNVRGAIAPHASFGEPGRADFKKPSRFLWREEDDGRRSRPLRQTAGGKMLRSHRFIPLALCAQRRGSRPSGPSPAKWTKVH